MPSPPSLELIREMTIKDLNTMILTTPAMSAGPQQLVLTNPDGETVSLDAAFSAQ